MANSTQLKAETRQPCTLPSARYTEPRIPLEEIRRRGEVLYAPLRAVMEADHWGQFLAIDVEAETHALGATSREAYSHLLYQNPDAMLYTLRIGFAASGKI